MEILKEFEKDKPQKCSSARKESLGQGQPCDHLEFCLPDKQF